jgi:adenine-specific DNA-methyltransferase
MRGGGIVWPLKDFRKFNAIADDDSSKALLIPSGTYVVTRRFTAKEEPRRVVASLLTPRDCSGEWVGIENHLNYFHANGASIDEDLARGLCLFLNSSLFDRYFRQFSGHTQVNATDLRNARYPGAEQLRRAGQQARNHEGIDQTEIDKIVQEELFDMGHGSGSDPLTGDRKIGEALEILKTLGLPREQQNDRSALTLLALVDLRPETAWSEASAPLRGITEMMGFFEEHYGKKYAPNTRETVRRFTMHQFVQAGLAIENPDLPGRPTNSPKWCYQIAPQVLSVIRVFGTAEWHTAVKELLVEIVPLRDRYAKNRDMIRIPVKLSPGKEIQLSPGGQNVLIKGVIEEFCERFTPGGTVVYVGDSAEKWGYFDEELLASLGVEVESHGKMPDVVIFIEKRNWLVLVEAVTSHGPVNPNRQFELKKLFSGSTAGLVFVSAFPDRKTLLKYLGEIAWETDVWCMDAPTHLIHFNGDRFLGPRE